MSVISIIIPIYNAEKYLARCLDSLLNQTFRDFEMILVNDGSTDSSAEICEEYRAKNPCIHILNKDNGGAASARNLGLDWYYKNSCSEWLCFVDSDDFVHESFLECLFDMAVKEQQDISMCSYKITNEDKIDCEILKNNVSCYDTESLWCERQINCTIPCAKLFKRELFTDIRFPEGIIHEDEFTLYKVLFKCEQIAFADIPLYGYYQTTQSVMRGDWSPKHMVEPEGIFSQLNFFLNHDYRDAASYTAKIYLRSIYRNLISSKKSGDVYRDYTRILKRQLQKGLVKYSKLAGINISNANWLFYEAYPVATVPYRVYKKCFGKVKR